MILAIILPIEDAWRKSLPCWRLFSTEPKVSSAKEKLKLMNDTETKPEDEEQVVVFIELQLETTAEKGIASSNLARRKLMLQLERELQSEYGRSLKIRKLQVLRKFDQRKTNE